MTAPVVSFGLYDLTIKPDSIPAMSGLQTFSNINDLVTGNIQPLPYATYEPNFWSLDGNFKFMPTDFTTVHLGIMSTAMSDVNSNFTSPPVLTITFGSTHSCSGLVLSFSQYTNDYADSITVAWYNASNTLILSSSYAPDTWQYQVDQAISNFKKIVITFNSTNNAYRYLRLTAIDFGDLIIFSGSEIKGANVTEEIDMLSTTVPGNTCSLQLLSDDAEFSIINPSGSFSNLAQRQPLSIYELVGNSNIFIGQYFLDTWKNVSDNEIEFDCLDYIGILLHMKYLGGIWLDGTMMSQTLISQIMEAASIPYDLDLALYNIPIIGWLPISNYRDALQQICFAIGAYVDCSRSSVVKIYQSVIASEASSGTAITKAQKGQDQSVSLNPLVTGVEITSHTYLLGTNGINLFSGILTVGTYEIDFSQPAYSLSISGATIVSSGANYAIISVSVAGAVALNGLEYVDTTQTFGVYTENLTASVTPNVLQITNATLVGLTNGQSVTQQVYDYYQQRYLQTVKLYAPFIQVGQLALVDTLYKGQILGVVEKMDIDLFSGFTAEVNINGVVA